MAYNYEYPYTDPNRYNADWLLNTLKQLSQRLDSTLLGNIIVFESLESLLKSDKSFNAGTAILVMRTGSYYKPSVWKVVDTGKEDILTHKTDGGIWVRYANTICDVRCLGVALSPINITSDINTILESDFAEIYFPEGDYVCHFDIKRPVKVYGDGIERTHIAIPYTIFYPECVLLDSDFITIEDIHFKAITNNQNVNGFVVPTKCDYSLFRRIRIENFSSGLLIQGRFIWNVLDTVECYGGFYAGLYVITAEPVNTNEFYSCRFDNNVNYGVYMNASGLSFNNTFYGCTIEGNAQERFGVASNVTEAVTINCFCNFEQCFFERNGIGNTTPAYRIISVYRAIANFNGCCFITEDQPILYISSTDSVVNFNGCYQYEQTNDFYQETSKKTANISGCNFINTQ